MGDHKTSTAGVGGAGTGLEPGTALTVTEAGTLAGVDVEVIQGAIDDGTLLAERQRRGTRERVVVRLFDLADLYPHVLGRPESAATPQGSAGAEAGAAPAPKAPATVTVPGPETLAEGAPRAALVELCQDLETRLDLAERERQASTASLLMAQRRVLDLEARLRSAPWMRAAGLGAVVLACGALAAAFTVPGRVEAAVERRAGDIEARVAEVARGAEATARELLATAAAREAELAEQRAAEVARHQGERRALEAALAGVETRLSQARERAETREADLTERLRGTEAEAAQGRERFTALLGTYADELAEARTAVARERAAREAESLARVQADADAAAALEQGLAELRGAAAESRAQVTELLEERRALEAAFRRAEETAVQAAEETETTNEPAPAAAGSGSGSGWWRWILGGR